MKRSVLIILSTVFVFCLSACTQPSGEAPRPNILWIVANDLSPDLGCYGNDAVHTPHLDQMAREGMMFENFITVGAVCSPNRSAMITGMYAVSINSHNQFTKYKQPLPEPVLPVTEYFRKAGYFVTNGGFPIEKSKPHAGYNFISQADELYDGVDWRQRAEGQPFFAQVNLRHSHRPFATDPDRPVDPDKVELPPYYPDHPVARKDWAMYLETIQLLDKQVGEILERLEKDGLAENTVVFFFADHGRPHIRGKQFLYEGGIHSPLIVRWPEHLKPGAKSDRLVSNIDVAPASMALAGIQIPDYMQGRDFLGDNSVPRSHVFSMRDRCDGTIDRIRAVRTKEFKYIKNFYPERPYTQFNAYKKWEYPMLSLMQVMYKKGTLSPEQARFMSPERPAEELYDLRKDPFELLNLAADPAYQEELKELRGELDNLLAEADKGSYPEDPREIEDALQVMEREFKEHTEAMGLSPESSDEEFLEYWEKALNVSSHPEAGK